MTTCGEAINLSLVFKLEEKNKMAKQKTKQIQEPQQIQTKSRIEEKQPTLSRNIKLSKDRKWLIIRTTRTDIVHVNYLEKVLETGEMQ